MSGPPSQLPQTSSEGLDTVPKRNQDEDGKSVSSNMKNLNLEQDKNPHSNKRAAAELAQQTHAEGGRPTKLRSTPSQHSPPAALYYDAARDQQPVNPRSHISEPPSHEIPSGVWSSTPAAQNGGRIFPRDGLSPPFQTSLDKSNPPLVNTETEGFASISPPTSPPFNTSSDKENTMLLQPETRPITQEQLVNEVKGIYAGLVMVEKKCVEVYPHSG